MAWSVVGEMVTGTSHRTGDIPCQDAFRSDYCDLSGGRLVVAVSDGAGSASHSEIGSNLACVELVRLGQALDRDEPIAHERMTELFSEVRDRLTAEAERLQIDPRELACTALLAVVSPTTSVFAQIGDGAIVYGAENEFQIAFWPQPAGYANETDFLTDPRFTSSLRFMSISQPVNELALLTDGLQRLALDFSERVPHAPFFRPLFEGLRNATDPDLLHKPLRSFLDSPRVNERTDDDKTLVLAVRRP